MTGGAVEVDPIRRARRAGRGPAGRGRGRPGRRRDRSVTPRVVLAGSLHSIAWKRTAPDPAAPRRGRRMKAWRDLPGRRPGARPRRDARRPIEAAGIDLDPVPPGHHRHGDDDPRERPRPPARALAARASRRSSGSSGPARSGPRSGVALSRAGWPIHAVASRDAGRRERFRALVGATRAFAEPGPLLDEVELIILAVPDDAIAPLAGAAPDVQRPGDGPHQRRARRRGPRAGDGGRDAGRRVPSAGRLRRHGAGGRRAPRRDGRDRGRRPAGGAAGRDGRGDRRPTRSASRPGRRPPTTPRRSWRPAGSSRCSTRSPSSAGSPAWTRPARWRSTGR